MPFSIHGIKVNIFSRFQSSLVEVILFYKDAAAMFSKKCKRVNLPFSETYEVLN